MPYMMLMPTLELGDPVMIGVFMEAGDPPLHDSGDESPHRPLSRAKAVAGMPADPNSAVRRPQVADVLS